MTKCKNCGHNSHCGIPLMKEFRPEGKGIQVKIFGGELPSNCTLIPESHSYITFKMECNDSTSLRE